MYHSVGTGTGSTGDGRSSYGGRESSRCYVSRRDGSPSPDPLPAGATPKLTVVTVRRDRRDRPCLAVTRSTPAMGPTRRRSGYRQGDLVPVSSKPVPPVVLRDTRHFYGRPGLHAAGAPLRSRIRNGFPKKCNPQRVS